MKDPDAPGTWDLDELHETPVTARARLKRIANGVIMGELDLKRRRQDELDREIELDRAKDLFTAAQALAQLHPDAPKVERNGATVADKAAWVEQRTAAEREAVRDAVILHKGAKMLSEAARRHYDRLDKQGMYAQSILRSIDIAFSRGTRADDAGV